MAQADQDMTGGGRRRPPAATRCGTGCRPIVVRVLDDDHLDDRGGQLFLNGDATAAPVVPRQRAPSPGGRQTAHQAGPYGSPAFAADDGVPDGGATSRARSRCAAGGQLNRDADPHNRAPGPSVHPPGPGRPGVGWRWPQPRPRPIPGFWSCPARCPGRSRACRGLDPGVDVIKVEQPGTGDDTPARGCCGATWPPTPVGRPEPDRRRTGRRGAAIVSWVTRRGAASTPTSSRRRPLLFDPGAALADRAATHRTWLNRLIVNTDPSGPGAADVAVGRTDPPAGALSTAVGSEIQTDPGVRSVHAH